MRLTPDFETTLRRYVLGDLEEGLRAELEELLVTDSDAFEALGVIEDELIEEYLDEGGAADERRAFGEQFLTSPSRQRSLLFARALRDRASIPPLQAVAPPEGKSVVGPVGWRPAWVGLAALLALSLTGNVWLASRHGAPEQRLEGVRPPAGAEHARPMATGQPQSALPAVAPPGQAGGITGASPDLQARLERERQERSKAEARVRTLEEEVRRSRAPVATFALAAGLLRAPGSLTRVAIPTHALVVRLRLELPADDYPLYRAALLDADGDELWAASKLRAEKEPGPAAVVLVLPSRLLPRGDYQMKLSGVFEAKEPEALATYTFRVSAP